MSEVRIMPDANGNVIRQSKNPDYGFVVVKQEKTSISNRGWINTSSRTALIMGTIEDLKKQKFKKNSKLPGCIYVLEQTEPFSMVYPERSLKYAGDTGIVCISADGEEIHRQTFYDPTGQTQDTTIAHVNGADISIANRAPKVTETEEVTEENDANTMEETDEIVPDYSSFNNEEDEEEEVEETPEVVEDVVEDVEEEILDEDDFVL